MVKTANCSTKFITSVNFCISLLFSSTVLNCLPLDAIAIEANPIPSNIQDTINPKKQPSVIVPNIAKNTLIPTTQDTQVKLLAKNQQNYLHGEMSLL